MKLCHKARKCDLQIILLFFINCICSYLISPYSDRPYPSKDLGPWEVFHIVYLNPSCTKFRWVRQAKSHGLFGSLFLLKTLNPPHRIFPEFARRYHHIQSKIKINPTSDGIQSLKTSKSALLLTDNLNPRRVFSSHPRERRPKSFPWVACRIGWRLHSTRQWNVDGYCRFRFIFLHFIFTSFWPPVPTTNGPGGK